MIRTLSHNGRVFVLRCQECGEVIADWSTREVDSTEICVASLQHNVSCSGPRTS